MFYIKDLIYLSFIIALMNMGMFIITLNDGGLIATFKKFAINHQTIIFRKENEKVDLVGMSKNCKKINQ